MYCIIVYFNAESIECLPKRHEMHIRRSFKVIDQTPFIIVKTVRASSCCTAIIYQLFSRWRFAPELLFDLVLEVFNESTVLFRIVDIGTTHFGRVFAMASFMNSFVDVADCTMKSRAS